MAEFTPCPTCRGPFEAYRQEREANYKRGIEAANAERPERSEEDEHAIALYRDLQKEENAHVHAAMLEAFKAGRKRHDEQEREETPNSQEEVMDADTRKELDALSGRLTQVAQQNEALKWGQQLARQETNFVRIHPDATEEEIDQIYTDIRDNGLYKNFSAHARAMFPDRFRPAPRTSETAEGEAEERERPAAKSEAFERPRASTTPREPRKPHIDPDADLETQMSQLRASIVRDTNAAA
jgi:hypothetical protein